MRLCENCSKELASTKRSHAIYCDIKCKKQAEHKRRIADPEKRKLNIDRARRWRENNPDRAKQKVSEWQAANKPRCREISRRYATRKAGACPPWITDEQKQEMESFYWLAQDLRAVTGEVYHVDHIVPLQGESVCGLHVPWNLQILPSDINIRKKNR